MNREQVQLVGEKTASHSFKINQVFLVVLGMCIFALCFAKSSEAITINYSFNGELTKVTDSYNLLNGQFAIGNTFSGSFTYDTSATEESTTVSDPTVAIYSAIRSFTVDINGYAITRDGILDGYLQVWNDRIVGPSVVDAFTVNSGLDFTPPVSIGPGTVVAGADVMFFDNTHTASKNGEAIPTTLDLNDFSALMFSAIELNTTNNQAFHLDGVITDIELIVPQPIPTPEPSTIILFGAGLLGFGMMRRRR